MDRRRALRNSDRSVAGRPGEKTIQFKPSEAKYVKLRMLRNQDGREIFYISELKVMEAQRWGYTPLLTRHPDLLGPRPRPEEPRWWRLRPLSPVRL